MKWEKVSLENISTRIGDGLHGTPKYEDSGEFYFINGNNLVNGKILIKDDTKRISGIEYDKIKKELGEKTVLVAINGTLGNVGLYRDEPVALGKSACYINVNEKAEKLFVKYVLENKDFQIYAHDFATGSTIKNLGLKAVRDYSFNLPPLPTQRRIASILSAYDDLIENNLKRIKLLEEKAFLSYKGIVKSEKLEKRTLSEFGEIITGKTPSTTNHAFFGDDIPFIKTPDMHKQIFIESTEQSLSELGAKSQEKKFLPPISLCVSCIGTAGVVGITSKLSQTNQQINSIVFKESKNVYFFYALMSQMKEQLDALGSNGSTFTNVNKNKFENMEVYVPNKNILNEFAMEHETSFKLILILQKQNSKLREARDILLPRLMSGDIEV